MVKGRVARLAQEAEEAQEAQEALGGFGSDQPPTARGAQKGRRAGSRRQSLDQSAGSGDEQDAGGKVGGGGRKPEGKGGGVEQKKCHVCGRRGHVRADCPRPDGNKRRVNSKKAAPKGARGQWRGLEGPGSQGQEAAAPEDFGAGYVDPCCCLHGCFARAGHYGTAEAFLGACGVPETCEAIVAVFADGACLDQSSDRYRCWDALLLEERVRGVFGCWPRHAASLQQTLEERLHEWVEANAGKVVGLAGGLDYSWSGSSEEDRHAQRAVLSRILVLARQRGLALMLCCEGDEAVKDMAQLMASSDLPSTHQVHLSSYSSDNDYLVLRLMPSWPNMRVGFDGRVTFAKAEDVRRLLFDIPLERLILQSSAPQSLPAPLAAGSAQGVKSVCHPGVVPTVARHVADLLNMDAAELMEAVRNNIRAAYGI